MNRPALRAPEDVLAAGARLPGWAPRAVLALVGVGLALVEYGFGVWSVVGLAIALVAAVWPRYLFGWGLIVLIAAGTLSHPLGLGWRVLVLLAGLHLLHVLVMLSLELPGRAWLQARLFLAPARRFVAIQVPVQLVAVAALLWLAPSHGGHRPVTGAALAAIGAAGLAVAGLVLFGRATDE